jgi:hypothetical protein
MQGAAGIIAVWAAAHGYEPVTAVCAFLAAALAAGALAYALLPQSAVGSS